MTFTVITARPARLIRRGLRAALPAWCAGARGVTCTVSPTPTISARRTAISPRTSFRTSGTPSSVSGLCAPGKFFTLYSSPSYPAVKKITLSKHYHCVVMIFLSDASLIFSSKIQAPCEIRLDAKGRLTYLFPPPVKQ